ncbi:Myosin light chain kinase smooth muscle, partial [Taenia solium]
MNCVIASTLAPVSIKWLRNGLEVFDSDRCEHVFAVDSGVASLVIKDFAPEDVGEYECVVVGNVVEPVTGDIQRKTIVTKTEITDKVVTVEVAHEVEVEEEVEEEKHELKSPLSEISSPIFETELVPINVIEGEEIYLSAVVKGKPQPMEVTWKHNGVVLQPDSTDVALFYIPEQGLCELTISEAFIEDAGIYEVEAVNEFGVAVSQTEVIVRALEEPREPESKEILLKEATAVEEEVHFQETLVPAKEVAEETSPLVEEAKPSATEELVEKDKLYEFKIGAKGKSKEKKEPEEEKVEVVEEEKGEGAPGPVKTGVDKVDGQGKKIAPKLEKEREGAKESKADLEAVVEVDGRGAPGSKPSPESVPAVTEEAGDEKHEEIEIPEEEFIEGVQPLPESTMKPTDLPATPVNLRAEVTPKKAPSRSQSVELTWDQPDGITPSEYLVEITPKGKEKWIEYIIVKKVGRKVTLSTKDMEEFTDYEFRITAQNQTGKSKPSEASNPIHLGIPLEFVRELPDIVVTQPPTEDEQIIFECELSRPSRKKVQWTKDGKPLPDKMPSHIHVSEDKNATVHRIAFDEVKDQDVGEYSIKAEEAISKGKIEKK